MRFKDQDVNGQTVKILEFPADSYSSWAEHGNDEIMTGFTKALAMAQERLGNAFTVAGKGAVPLPVPASTPTPVQPAEVKVNVSKLQ